MTVIAFVGSVFSPYYRRALLRGAADAENHVALNVALYGQGVKRWTMTERGRGQLVRSASELQIGPSRLHWDGQALVIDIDEIALPLPLPLPRRVRGRVRVHPLGLCGFTTVLDAAGRHRWGPIAPCARIEVEFDQPGLRWSGHAYLDCNEGDEPVARAFSAWDWSRALLRDGSTAVIYDVRAGPGEGDDGGRVIAQRFATDGCATAFEAPPRQSLPRSKWWLGRTLRSDPAVPARVRQTLEDTPFYVRSVLDAGVLGERVTAVHETLDIPRLVSLPVQGMLPFRMPRRT